jgi:hypothetical protein
MAAPTDRTVADAVARALEGELAARGLLLGAGAFAAADAEVAREGAALLARAMRCCFPALRHGADVEIAFADDTTAARLGAALVFGAVSGRVLAPRGDGLGAGVRLASAIFNLAVGLVDGVCDDDGELGLLLLDHVRSHDVREASATQPERGRLRATAPPALLRDHAAAFALAAIEALFEALHAAYPGDAGSECRLAVGGQLEAALDAERRTLVRPAGPNALPALVGCSRATSVLPFEIVATLAAGAPAAGRGTRLGEAMWRIDDLVDLGDDAASGALNGLLLEAGSLERVVESGLIGRAAARAAADLEAALRPAADESAVLSFLCFVQRYAGLAP